MPITPSDMGKLRNIGNIRRDERGFTLQELMVTIAILGILIAIAIIIWLGLLEQRRVDAAINQLASDLRLAHTRATNQLTDWRVVIYPERNEESAGVDYYLVKLTRPYKEEDLAAVAPTLDPATSPIPRYLPENVEIMNQTTNAGALIIDDTALTYYLDPGGGTSSRSVELNSDGTMWGRLSPSGTIRVTIDGDPVRSLTYVAATSRIKIAP